MTVRFNHVIQIFAGLLFLASCVPNRKVVLLQKNDVNANDLLKDSIIRSYQVDAFDYKIQPNDILSVRFESLTPKEYNFFSAGNSLQQGGANLAGGNAALIGELVDESGEIPFPVVGKVKVSGQTVFQIQDQLQALATKYLESPIVKVRLINFRITILGDVQKEGVVVLTNNRVNLLEAIASAGGLGEFADRSKVKLIRQIGNKTQVAYIDLLDENFFNSPYYYVYQNDILIVPSLKQKPFRKYFGTNLTLVVSTLSLFLLVLNLSK